MNKFSMLLACSAVLGANPVAAAVVPPAATVTFSESAVEGGLNPTPGVQSTGQYNASGGLFSTVTLLSFFSQTPGSFSYTYNLLEPGTGGVVSDQVTFSGGGLLGTSLFLVFTSDPLNFVQTSYGSIDETGSSQSISLPPNLPTSPYKLTVMASSELEGAVPEPSTWAMMLLGMGAIGYSVRRRPVKAVRQVA